MCSVVTLEAATSNSQYGTPAESSGGYVSATHSPQNRSPLMGKFLGRAEVCPHCGKSPGILLGRYGFGLRSRGHEQRCFRRRHRDQQQDHSASARELQRSHSASSLASPRSLTNLTADSPASDTECLQASSASSATAMPVDTCECQSDLKQCSVAVRDSPLLNEHQEKRSKWENSPALATSNATVPDDQPILGSQSSAVPADVVDNGDAFPTEDPSTNGQTLASEDSIRADDPIAYRHALPTEDTCCTPSPTTPSLSRIASDTLIPGDDTNGEMPAIPDPLFPVPQPPDLLFGGLGEQSNAEMSTSVSSTQTSTRTSPSLPTTEVASTSQEKFVFVIRHAESKWNVPVEAFKQGQIGDCIAEMSNEMWTKDHQLSDQGIQQAHKLREAMETARKKYIESSSSKASGSTCRPEADRERIFYERLLREKLPVYCSPLLRALQTALLALPEEDWGPIVLLKDAREKFSSGTVFGVPIERDCLGTCCGKQIVERAMRKCESKFTNQEVQRVDTSDCEEQWWSDTPESDAQIGERLESLLRRLLDEDPHGNCVVVTHSNLIKELLMKHGDVASTVDGSAGNASMESSDEMDGSFECSLDEWEVVSSGPDLLRQAKLSRLENCGVLGLRCTHETRGPECRRWVVKDACLMFCSRLLDDQHSGHHFAHGIQ